MPFIKFRNLLTEDVSFSLRLEEEHISPEQHFIEECKNYDDDTVEMIKGIKKRLSRGDLWAWCVVIVEAEWNGMTGSTSLGCCSYDNEKDFKDDGCFDDMCEEALDELNRNLRSKFYKIEPLLSISED